MISTTMITGKVLTLGKTKKKAVYSLTIVRTAAFFFLQKMCFI